MAFTETAAFSPQHEFQSETQVLEVPERLGRIGGSVIESAFSAFFPERHVVEPGYNGIPWGRTALSQTIDLEPIDLTQVDGPEAQQWTSYHEEQVRHALFN